MAIIRALARRPQTAKELLAGLSDVSQATLYRHIALLRESGTVDVVAERQAHGAVERTYGLAAEAIVSGSELSGASREDHFRYFATFASGLLGEYSNYVAREDIDLERDGVGFREHVFNLTDAELREMLAEVRAVLEARSNNAPSAGRIPRLIATVTMPITPREPEES